MRKRIGVVFGTRPDAIKMAPVVFELCKYPGEFEPVVISTGQHRQMLDQVLQVFDVSADIELDLMRHNQTLNGLTCRILAAMDTLLAENPLDCLLVQGDTTTAFAAALAAFYRKVPVAHIEAGLRSRDIFQPWPEEVNRRLTAVVTQLHFAPTPAGPRQPSRRGGPRRGGGGHRQHHRRFGGEAAANAKLSKIRFPRAFPTTALPWCW